MSQSISRRDKTFLLFLCQKRRDAGQSGTAMEKQETIKTAEKFTGKRWIQ